MDIITAVEVLKMTLQHRLRSPYTFQELMNSVMRPIVLF